VFQPHTYTRTRDFAAAFADALTAADVAIVTDVYPARETPIDGINGDLIIRHARVHTTHPYIKGNGAGKQTAEIVTLHTQLESERQQIPPFYYAPTLNDVHHRLDTLLEPGDVLITMGAGNIVRVAEKFVKE